MSENGHSAKPAGGQFNTLAQNGTGYDNKPAILINGKGSDLSDNKAMKGRAKRKIITQSMTLSLISVAEKRHTQDRLKSYWNTYYCQNRILTAYGLLFGKYCKNRFCTLCCSVRKAVIINKYLPVLKTWNDAYFVTLTARSIPVKSLKKRMSDLIRGLRKISSKYRKRSQRGKGVKLMGVKSLECNFNPDARTYNPHLHLIVATEEMADIIVAEWLALCTRKFAQPWAQHRRKVENTEKALIEIVKYGSKIFTEPALEIKQNGKGRKAMHVAALDNIFNGMKGLRIFDRFGFNLPTEEAGKKGVLVAAEYDEWVFEAKYFDWYNVDTGEALLDFNPEPGLHELLGNCINTDLQ